MVIWVKWAFQEERGMESDVNDGSTFKQKMGAHFQLIIYNIQKQLFFLTTIKIKK